MKCSGCGNENPEIARFCFSCGNTLTTIAATRDSAGLRVRAPSGSRDDGLTVPTAQLDTSGTPAVKTGKKVAAPSRTDQALKAVGNAETAPFEPSPLGSDTLPEAKHGVNVSDTILDLPRMDELIAEMDRRKKAGGAGRQSADFDHQPPPEPPPGVGASTTGAAQPRRADDAEPAWVQEDANAATTLPPDAATERPISLHDSAGLSGQLRRGDHTFDDEDPDAAARAAREADVHPRSAATGPTPKKDWEQSMPGDADAAGSLFDYELRQVRKVQWTHRLLLVLLVGFLAGAAYFLYKGVSAMGRASVARPALTRTAAATPSMDIVGRTSLALLIVTLHSTARQSVSPRGGPRA